MRCLDSGWTEQAFGQRARLSGDLWPRDSKEGLGVLSLELTIGINTIVRCAQRRGSKTTGGKVGKPQSGARCLTHTAVVELQYRQTDGRRNSKELDHSALVGRRLKWLGPK